MYIHKYCNKNCKKKELIVPNINVFLEHRFTHQMSSASFFVDFVNKYPHLFPPGCNRGEIFKKLCDLMKACVHVDDETYETDETPSVCRILSSTTRTCPLSHFVNGMSVEDRAQFLLDFATVSKEPPSTNRVDGVMSDTIPCVESDSDDSDSDPGSLLHRKPTGSDHSRSA